MEGDNKVCGIEKKIAKCHTHKCQLAGIIQFFSETMAMLLRVEIIIWDSATFHPWMREWHTSRCLLVDVIQCFYEVMGRVWPADVISLTSATFHLQRRGVSGWVSQLQAVDICAMPI